MFRKIALNSAYFLGPPIFFDKFANEVMIKSIENEQIPL